VHFCLFAHRAELDYRESVTVKPDANLPVKDRAMIGEFNGDRNGQHDRRKHDQPDS
jgi:hypothetical protein